MAETFGTMIFIFIGCSGVAQFKLNNKQDANLNNILSVNIAFGFGVLMAILLVGTISGMIYILKKFQSNIYFKRCSFKSRCFFLFNSGWKNDIKKIFYLLFGTNTGCFFRCNNGLLGLSRWFKKFWR